MGKLLSVIFVVLVLPLLAAYGYLYWSNNRDLPPPQQAQLEAARERAIGWLTDNREAILEDNNSILWRMLQQAGEVSGDPRLQSLFGDYEKRHLQQNYLSFWRPLFYPGTWSGVRAEDITRLPDYNQHFIYAISCDAELGRVAAIAAQNEADFCDSHPWRPACVTHQLMGIRMLQRSSCGSPGQLATTLASLQERIVKQLTRDPRVVDVYIQRVLMLTESGARARLKPVWLQRIMDAQLPDGGWGRFQPLVPLGGTTSLGFSRIFIGISSPQATFHATAQGVLLFTLLSQPSKP
jgi:hypothetical protein